MAQKDRSVAKRQESLQPKPFESQFTIRGVQRLFAGVKGREIQCTINGYCRTQVFEFPSIAFHPDGEEPPHQIYKSSSVRGTVTSNLVDFFVTSSFSGHYAIAPSLRHRVGETDEKVRAQQKDRVPVFLVVEEVCQFPPVEMKNGECSLVDEAVLQDGEMVRYLVGGREGESFIFAQTTADGAWPDLPNNQPTVNLILAGVRVGQQTARPIRKYLELDCLVTDDGRFVSTGPRLTAEARLSRPTSMDTKSFREKVTEIRDAIVAMERDICVPHLALLFNAMYRDEYGDDAYQRLQYLQLWQSLSEVGPRKLSYQGDIRNDDEAVAGKKTLSELRDYRDDIAHWWTDTIDEAFLADLQHTINELIRRKYFCLPEGYAFVGQHPRTNE